MLEIEQKYACDDLEAVAARLRTMGAEGPEVEEEADQYFNAPDRDFARTGEAFRLRRVGEKNFFTFKGPRQKSEVKVRRELEIALPDGDEAAAQHMDLLAMLGYRPVGVVRKKRRSYRLTGETVPVTVCLDEVSGLGSFAEVEALATQEQAATVAAALTGLARDLGLTRVEPRAYLTIQLQGRARGTAEGTGPVLAGNIAELQQALAEARRKRFTIGLVPTMGALHEGHLSLVRAAARANDFVVVTVFVNPTQFGPGEDLERYPRPFEDDVRKCTEAGVHLIFHPGEEEIYPPGYRAFVEVKGIQDAFEGASRPGHFRGVATVVLKLFNLVRPDRAYFGQKDAQQARIIQKMVADLNVPVEVVVCPTLREPDGLALSSRNRYLDSEQRRHAAALSRALTDARELFAAGQRDPDVLREVMATRINATPGAVLDYAAVIDPETFQPAERAEPGTLLALAVKFGGTRLIDNTTLGDEKR